MAADRTGPLGILAGGGTLPRRVAEATVSQGRSVFIVAFAGQFDPGTIVGYPHAVLRIGEAGRIIETLKDAGVVDLVMAGGVRRPSLIEIKPDWRGVRLLARIGAGALGDDGLLAAIGRELEREGFRLVGASEILSGAAVAAGVLGRHSPDDTAHADIAHGLKVARVLGLVDVGQAVVVQQGLVLGVEAIEGTDALLARVGPLGREGPGGVLVKIAKPQQDRRIDLPTIGPATVAAATAAGLRGIAVEAGGAIVLDRAETIAAADAAGLFLIAVDAPAA
jgi:DUF1009 family protein